MRIIFFINICLPYKNQGAPARDGQLEIVKIQIFKGRINQLTLQKVVDFFRAKILVKSSSSPYCPA